jgi:hypothetical protein
MSPLPVDPAPIGGDSAASPPLPGQGNPSAASCLVVYDESQLHDDEGVNVNRKRRRAITAEEKLEAVAYAKKVTSIKSAATMYSVGRNNIREWMKDENAIKHQM